MKFYWGCALNNQNKEFFFFVNRLCELLHFLLLDLCYMVDVGAQGVVFLSPFDCSSEWISWAILCNRGWWLFCASVNPGRVSSASTRVPRFAFCDVAQICKCVCVCVCVMVLCWKLYLDFEKTVFNLCVSCVLCSRVLCAFFFPPLLVESCFYVNSRICELCPFCVAATEGSWRRGGGGLGVKSRGWDVRILVNWGLGFFCEQ
jgi:hypothetical protein